MKFLVWTLASFVCFIVLTLRLLILYSNRKHVLQLPSFLQRFSAGSVYARILTTAIDALRQAQEYEFALKVLNLLMAQNIYGIKLKGEWALKQATLYHVNTKDIIKVSLL